MVVDPKFEKFTPPGGGMRERLYKSIGRSGRSLLPRGRDQRVTGAVYRNFGRRAGRTKLCFSARNGSGPVYFFARYEHRHVPGAIGA